MSEAKINLVVVSHPDDEILGFGATGAKLTGQGDIVQPVILCGNVDARTRRPTDEQLHADMTAANEKLGFGRPILGEFPNIRMNTVPHLELVQFIEAQIATFRPHRLFTHHPSDLNDDHKQVHRACLAAARLFQRRDEVRPLEMIALMEIPSATDWGFPVGEAPFIPNMFVDVADTLDAKLAALACYRNVMRDYPHPRSTEAIRGLAALRGAQCGSGPAEAFQMIFGASLI